jgi:fatty acid desaturase
MTDTNPPSIARLLQSDRQSVRQALQDAGLSIDDFQGADRAHAFRYLLICWSGVIALAVAWSMLNGAWKILLVPAIAILQHAMLNIVHEASHYSLLTDKRWNDRVASLFAALPLGHTVASYRMTHNDHHNYLRTPQDPSSYVSDPNQTNREIRRTLFFLLCGRLVWELLARSLLGRRFEVEAAADAAAMKTTDRDRLLATLLFQLIALAFWYSIGMIGFWIAWLIIVVTVTPVLDGLRTIVEHRTPPGFNQAFHTRTHHRSIVVSSLMAPLFQYHWEHHLFPGIGHYQLAHLHATLIRLDVEGARPVDTGFFGTLWQLI